MWIKRRWQWIPAITVLCFLTVDLLPHILLLPFHGFHIQNCIFCLKFLTLNFLINIVLSIFSFYQILWFLFQHASTSGRPRENEHESFQNSNNTTSRKSLWAIPHSAISINSFLFFESNYFKMEMLKAQLSLFLLYFPYF